MNLDPRRLSRRQLLRVGLGTAAGLGLATGFAPHSFALREASAAGAYRIYRNATEAEHRARYGELKARGYRILSLCIHGGSGNPRYAAVWIERPGPDFFAVHSVTADEYGAASAKAQAVGYAPTLVSATGSARSARFTGVFERGVPGAWQLYVGMTAGNADSPENGLYRRNRLADQGHMYIRSLTTYGDPWDRRYAAIWHTAKPYFSTGLYASLSSVQYQQVFDGVTQGKRHYRPGTLALAGDNMIAAVFYADEIGPWIGRHNLTNAQYEAAFADALKQGLFPICLQVGGAGSYKRYAAIFADYNAVAAGTI